MVLRGGEVLDGTGAPAYRADVGVTGGRITAVGRLTDALAGTVIDARGRYVTPGFVDTHAHAEAAVLSSEVQLATLRQGVTTLILGQDGLSFAPSTPAALAFVRRYFGAINGEHPGLGDGGVSVAQLRSTWHGTTAVNTAYLVPAATVRYSVLDGRPGRADPAGLARMRELVETGLADGAVGLSSGLEYLPGRYADAEGMLKAGTPYAVASSEVGASVIALRAEARL